MVCCNKLKSLNCTYFKRTSKVHVSGDLNGFSVHPAGVETAGQTSQLTLTSCFSSDTWIKDFSWLFCVIMLLGMSAQMFNDLSFLLYKVIRWCIPFVWLCFSCFRKNLACVFKRCFRLICNVVLELYTTRLTCIQHMSVAGIKIVSIDFVALVQPCTQTKELRAS